VNLRGFNQEQMMISVLLPVMNEVKSLNSTIELLEGLNRFTSFEHIIILSQFSTKESIENAQRLEIRHGGKVQVILQDLPGLGGALQSGICRAKGDYILMMASDLETDPHAVPELIATCLEFPGAIISTTRWRKQSVGFVGYGKVKMIFNWLFQKFIGILYQTSLTDLTYGFRLYPSEVIKKELWQRTDFAFLLESILVPLRDNVQVVEIPVVWKRREEGRSSNSIKQMIMYLFVAVKLRINP
jgi:glycosyltransferase involved in cell wall biosynthesis